MFSRMKSLPLRITHMPKASWNYNASDLLEYGSQNLMPFVDYYWMCIEVLEMRGWTRIGEKIQDGHS